MKNLRYWDLRAGTARNFADLRFAAFKKDPLEQICSILYIPLKKAHVLFVL
jgi:hypothetical protein